ncbi:MAG: membrane protein insertase YidC [Acidobacteria bacterium]|nr:membrane protein insertase YidC [Acidobacteriota bacterium]
MERRVLLAISLSFLVLFVYQTYFAPPPPPAGPAAVAPVSAPASPGPSPEPVSAAAAPPVSAPAVVAGEAAERDIVVETANVRAVFTNRGARLRHWVLKHYKNDAGELLDLVPDQELVNHAYLPFSLRFENDAQTTRANGGLFSSSARDTVDATSARTSIAFEWQDADGLRVEKTFTFDPQSYILEALVVARQGDQPLRPLIEWGPGLGDDNAHATSGSFLAPSSSTPAQALYHHDNAVTRLTAATPGTETGPFLFAGIDDHYFAALLLNDREQPDTLRFSHTSFVVPPKGEDLPPGRYTAFAVGHDNAARPYRFFIGPKAIDTLKGIDTELVRAINFGIFAWLAVPLLGALKWMHQFVGNWGWAIIALTLLINIAMFPLRQKSMSSMRKMQEIQPQMKAIQERYAKYSITDPQRQKMNEEVMALYKTKGVNPASGCVPMLLTFPFLFAFYAMLSQAIELRGADFAGWINDLSRPDPLYITPLLMGATMFWQQKITPTSADPVQQRVMMIMPIMFTFMFLSYPSGLVIYWTMSNLWAIGQQYATMSMPAAAKAK